MPKRTIDEARAYCESEGGNLINDFEMGFYYEEDIIEKWAEKQSVRRIMEREDITAVISEGVIIVHVKPEHRLYKCDVTGEIWKEEDGTLHVTDPRAIRRMFVELGMLPKAKPGRKEPGRGWGELPGATYKGWTFPPTMEQKNITNYGILMKYPKDEVMEVLDELGVSYMAITRKMVDEILNKLIERDIKPEGNLNYTQKYVLYSLSQSYVKKHFPETYDKIKQIEG